MIDRLKLRLYIWALDHGWAKCQPWEDPRRSRWDRIAWKAAEPKSLGNVQELETKKSPEATGDHFRAESA